MLTTLIALALSALIARFIQLWLHDAGPEPLPVGLPVNTRVNHWHENVRK